jgi:hypothetical protein
MSSSSSTNPFSRFLRGRLDPGAARTAEAEAFVGLWDELETFVIAVYRQAGAGPAEELQWQRLRAGLKQCYPKLEVFLGPHWRAARRSGEPLAEDPFLGLLDLERASEIVGNWPAMQTLPPAREALNTWLLSQGQARAKDDSENGL